MTCISTFSLSFLHYRYRIQNYPKMRERQIQIWRANCHHGTFWRWKEHTYERFSGLQVSRVILSKKLSNALKENAINVNINDEIIKLSIDENGETLSTARRRFLIVVPGVCL